MIEFFSNNIYQYLARRGGSKINQYLELSNSQYYSFGGKITDIHIKINSSDLIVNGIFKDI